MRLVGLLENGKRIPGLLVDETHFVDLSSIERDMDDGLLGGIVSGDLLRELAASD
jgi:hypothetical protein